MILDLIKKGIDILLDPWVVVGLAGQGIFFSRVLLQWIASEKKKSIVIPITYWHLSIVGALILLVYALHQRDVVFIIAYILNVLIFTRSLVIHKNQIKRETSENREAI